LWLHGIPGAGKTIICSTIIEYMTQFCKLHPSSKIAFYYFDFRDSRKQTLSSLLRSVILQFCSQKYLLPDEVVSLYEKFDNLRQDPTVDDLSSVYLSLLCEPGETYLVIDALDEYTPKERESFYKTVIGRCSPRGLSFNLLITSRKERDIEEALKDVVQHTICIQRAAVDADVRLYIRKAIADHPRLNDAMRREVEDKIVAGTQGMYVFS
jgi:hypothetical protein